MLFAWWAPRAIGSGRAACRRGVLRRQNLPAAGPPP
ncbi:unnamed protein product [Amoebophrya sp. A120]|nr:unnamed protein product [Amoebophrya sp. A120]